MRPRVGERPQTALPSRHHHLPDTHLTSCLGEVDRLRSSVAKEAAAMQAMGVLLEAKALKLDVNGGYLVALSR